MKKFILTILLFTVFIRLHAEVIPLFDRPDASGRILAAERSLLQETGEKKRLLITEHPLLFIHEFSGMKLPDGRMFYYRDDLVFQDGTVKRLPLLLGNSSWILKISSLLIPAMLIGAAADLLRCRKYAAAGFIVLSALFYYAPVELMGIAMFLLLIFSAMRLLIPEKFKRAAADFLSESKRRFLQKKI